MTTTKTNGATSAPSLAKPAPAPKPKVVGKLESIEVDVDIMLAALTCAPKNDETRYYLCGLYLHRTPDKFVRCVATDGNRILVANLYRENPAKPGPKWLDYGAIIPADGLGARLKLIAKEHGDLGGGAKISFAENAPRIEIADRMGVNVFRVSPIDGTFPNYDQITARWTGTETTRGDWKPTGFAPEFLKSVGDVAKVLGAETVECFDYQKDLDGQEQPILFTFGAVTGVVLFLMPARNTPDKLAEANRLLLAPAIRGTVAALRAHETRNTVAAKELKGADRDAALAKAKDYADRIKAILDRVGSGQVQAALPAPKAKKPAAPKAPGAAKPKAATKKKQ